MAGIGDFAPRHYQRLSHEVADAWRRIAARRGVPVVTGRKGGIRASGGSGSQRSGKEKVDDGVVTRRYDASHHPVALWRRGWAEARRDGVTGIQVTTQCLAATAAAQAVDASQGTARHIRGSARMGAMPPRLGDCRGSAESIALPESLSGVWREPRSRREASRGRGAVPVVAPEARGSVRSLGCRKGWRARCRETRRGCRRRRQGKTRRRTVPHFGAGSACPGGQRAVHQN